MKNQDDRVIGFKWYLRKILVVCFVVYMGVVSALPKDNFSAIPAENWGLVDALQTGTSISVRMISGDRMDGKFLALDTDSVRLLMDKKERIYPRNSVAEVWRLRVPDPKLNGALIGMGVGALAGIIGAVATDASFGGEDAWGAGFVMAGIGIGAALGLTTDAMIKGDKLIYRKQSRAGGLSLQGRATARPCKDSHKILEANFSLFKRHLCQPFASTSSMLSDG